MKRIISKARSLIAGAPRKKTARTNPRGDDATASRTAGEPANEGASKPDAPEDGTLKALENAVVGSCATGAEPESQPQPGPDRGLSAAEHGSNTPPKGEALIRSALATRRRQSKVLANLSAEERRRLRLLATKLLMGNDPGATH